VPQGSPLSPLLSNIMLNELDKEMEKQGLRYVRYADDLVFTLKVIMLPKDREQYIFVLEEQIETAHQQGEKRDTQTGKLHDTGIRIRAHIRKGRERQISVGSKR